MDGEEVVKDGGAWIHTVTCSNDWRHPAGARAGQTPPTR